MIHKQIGAVVYEDTNFVFRVVYPEEKDPDDILDDPQWVTIGVDPNRKARMVKLDADNPDWSQFAGVPALIAPLNRSFFSEPETS